MFGRIRYDQLVVTQGDLILIPLTKVLVSCRRVNIIQHREKLFDNAVNYVQEHVFQYLL